MLPFHIIPLAPAGNEHMSTGGTAKHSEQETLWPGLSPKARKNAQKHEIGQKYVELRTRKPPVNRD